MEDEVLGNKVYEFLWYFIGFALFREIVFETENRSKN
ncbi:unnamed protein product, partial [marine sediment metagenome]